jgi:hypothetical protein
MKNREIKFRAWDISGETPYMLGPYDLTDSIFNSVEVRQLSLMQYTGLKDKFGIEIYEDDIVLFKDNLCKVHYEFAGFRISSLPNIDVSNINTNRDFEVIGNIYENPELIK